MSIGEPLVVLESAMKRYGARVALQPTSLQLGAGECFGIAGPHGAGKSTLARLIAGFAHPTEGSVLVRSLPASVHRTRHGIGYLAEEMPRAWRCSVGGFLSLRSMAPGPISAQTAAQLLDLEPLWEKPIHNLSKGQWRLVLTAYACIGPAGVVILDEPDSGLDPRGLDRLRSIIIACRERGALVVVLSHQMTELDAVCDRIAFVSDGALLHVARRESAHTWDAAATYRELIR